MNKEAREALAVHRKFVILQYAQGIQILILQMEEGLLQRRQGRSDPQETGGQKPSPADSS